MVRFGEVHDRLVAVLLELALAERSHNSGPLALCHTRRHRPMGYKASGCAPTAARRSVQEPVRLELGRDLLDGLLDVRGLAGPRADDLAAAEHEQDDLGLVDAVHEAGELLRLVLDGPEPEGDRDRVQVDLGAEVRRGDDVLDLDLRVLLDRDAGRLDLLRYQVDRRLHVLEALRARADDLPAAEQEDRGLRLLDPVDEAGELLRLVFGAAQGKGDRLEVELVPEGSRCDDVFDPELRHGNTSGPGSGIPASLEATARNRSLIYFRPPRNPIRKTERTVAGDCRAAESRTLPTLHASMRSTRPFASAHRSRRRNAWVSAPLSAITSPFLYVFPVSQSLTTRRTRSRGFC